MHLQSDWAVAAWRCKGWCNHSPRGCWGGVDLQQGTHMLTRLRRASLRCAELYSWIVAPFLMVWAVSNVRIRCQQWVTVEVNVNYSFHVRINRYINHTVILMTFANLWIISPNSKQLCSGWHRLNEVRTSVLALLLCVCGLCSVEVGRKNTTVCWSSWCRSLALCSVFVFECCAHHTQEYNTTTFFWSWCTSVCWTLVLCLRSPVCVSPCAYCTQYNHTQCSVCWTLCILCRTPEQGSSSSGDGTLCVGHCPLLRRSRCDGTLWGGSTW